MFIIKITEITAGECPLSYDYSLHLIVDSGRLFGFFEGDRQFFQIMTFQQILAE